MEKSRQAAQAYVTQTGRRVPPPRVSFGDYTESVMSTYRTHEKELYIEGLNPAEVMDLLASYRAAVTKEHDLAAQLAEAREARQRLAASVWVPMLDVYQRARSAARTSPVIKHAIFAFEQFMKIGRSKKKDDEPALP